MKQLIAVLVVLIIIIVAVILLRSGAPEDVERSEVGEPVERTAVEEESDEVPAVTLDEFTFTGYGPGKKHDGTFDRYEISEVTMKDGLPTSGKIVFDVSSVNTDGGQRLNDHLCTDDFFDCANHPNITFELVSATESDGVVNVVGNLTAHGITKSIEFDVNRTEEGFSADFIVDSTPFDLKYVAVDKEVRVQFSGTVN